MKAPSIVIALSMLAASAAAAQQPLQWTDLGPASSTGEGITGGMPGASDYPSMTVDKDGYPIVVWTTNLVSTWQIFAKKWDGQNWVGLDGSDQGWGLSQNPGYNTYPAVVADAQGNPVVVWQHSEVAANNVVRVDVYVKRWVPGADGQPGAWREIGPSSASGPGVSKGQGGSISRQATIALGPDGSPCVAWSYSGSPSSTPQIYLKRWDAGADDWVELAQSARGSGISSSGDGAGLPSIAFDETGSPVVAWQHRRITGSSSNSYTYDIWVRRLRNDRWEGMDGTMGGGVTLNATQYFAQVPKVMKGPGVRIFLAWQQVIQMGPVTEIHFLEWDGDGWRPLGASANPPGLSATGGVANTPSLQVDAAGRPVVAWSQTFGDFDHVFLRAWDGQAWVGVGGSDAGTGISPGGVSNPFPYTTWPSLALGPEGEMTVAWLSTGDILVRALREPEEGGRTDPVAIEDDGRSGASSGGCGGSASVARVSLALALIGGLLGFRRR